MSITPATCPALRPRGHAALAAAWSRPRGPSHLSYLQFCSQSIFSGRVLAKHQPALDVYASKSSVLHAISLQPPRRNHFKPSKKTKPQQIGCCTLRVRVCSDGLLVPLTVPPGSFPSPSPSGQLWPGQMRLSTVLWGCVCTQLQAAAPRLGWELSAAGGGPGGAAQGRGDPWMPSAPCAGSLHHLCSQSEDGCAGKRCVPADDAYQQCWCPLCVLSAAALRTIRRHAVTDTALAAGQGQPDAH